MRGRKRHLLCVTIGLSMRVEVHSAGMQDREGAAQRFSFVERFSAEAGYQGPRAATAAPGPVEIVKRTLAWITINCRLARDFQAFAQTVQTLIHAAMIKLMPRRRAR